MLRRFHFFVTATLATGLSGALEGPLATNLGTARFGLVVLLFLSTLAGAGDILRGPPPI